MAEESIDRRPLGDGTAGPERGARRTVQPLIVAAIVIAGLYFGRPVLEPLALAVLLSLMLVPVVRWLGHWIGRVAAVLLSVLVASVLMLGVIAAITEQAIGLIENLPRLRGEHRSQNPLPRRRSKHAGPGQSGVSGSARSTLRCRRP